MKERPILFSAPMVRAILSGTKTQTRRAVKPQITPLAYGSSWHQFDHRGSNYRTNLRNGTVSQWSPLLQFCPFGQPGDRLWVRETWAAPHSDDARPPRSIHCDWMQIHYAATEERGGLLWRPSIHMPRWASRITLEIIGVRVERLQDISEDDAKAEGAWGPDDSIISQVAAHFGCEPIGVHPSLAYRMAWEQINGAGSWEANPLVWAVEFKRVNGRIA